MNFKQFKRKLVTTGVNIYERTVGNWLDKMGFIYK